MPDSLQLIYNGKLFPADKPVIPVVNRAFQFGDGLFESIRIINGRPCFLDNHLNRMKLGLQALDISPGPDFDLDRLEGELFALIKENDINQGGRARITVSRAPGGRYNPTTEEGVDYLIEAQSLERNHFALNEKGLVLDVYTDMRKQVNRLSCFKTLNCQLYIMASLKAKADHLDDVLITNDKDIIIESANSNIFIVSNGVLYTPPLDDGCLGGTMRMEIINTALRNDIKVYETSLRPQNLLVADELFLTNAIQGIRWVSSYRQKRYYHRMAEQLVGFLNQEVNP